MATRAEFQAVLTRMFGLFLFAVAAGNVLVGTLDFGILFAVIGFVFVALSGYITSNPEEFGQTESVSNRLVRGVAIGGWALILGTGLVIAALALS